MPAGPRSRGPAASLRYQIGKLLPYLYAAIAVIGMWWMVVLVAKPHMSLLPSPFTTAQTFIALLATGELERHAAYSVCRVLAAWSLAALFHSHVDEGPDLAAFLQQLLDRVPAGVTRRAGD